MAHLITGYAGSEHIQSKDQGSFNAAFFGDGQYVMEIGSQLEGSIINNNTIRILDGDLLMHGRHIRIEPDTYEDMVIETGTAGTNRIDLICMTYEKNALDGTEISYLEVVKGNETPGAALLPSYIVGNILNGDSKNQMPLYQVKIEGVALASITPLFTTIPTYKSLAEQYAEKFKKDCESHLNSLGVLDTMEEVEANTQANQVAGALALKEASANIEAAISAIHKDMWTVDDSTTVIYGVGEPSENKYPPEAYYDEQYAYVDVTNGNFYQVVDELVTSGGYASTIYKWELQTTLNSSLDALGKVYKIWNTVNVTLNSDTSTEICSMTVPAGTYLITAQLGYSALMTHAGIYFSNINQMDNSDVFYKPQVGSNLSTYDISLTTFCIFNKETTITLKAKGNGHITPDLRINALQAVRLK